MKSMRRYLPGLLAIIVTPALTGAKGGCAPDVIVGELGGMPGNNHGTVSYGGSTSGGSSNSGAATSVGGKPTDTQPNPTVNPVSFETETVKLTAKDFELVVDGQRYYVNEDDLEIHSDPGDSTYTTLELTWTENNREMRFFVYLNADDNHWWSEEIRTRDGQVDSEWLYYYGRFFATPLGQSYESELLTITNNGPEDSFDGTITFRGLTLHTTFSP